MVEKIKPFEHFRELDRLQNRFYFIHTMRCDVPYNRHRNIIKPLCARVFQLKTLSDSELEREIESYTVKFELESMIHTKSKHLSGGMKRKLSVAIALIGKSKVRTSRPRKTVGFFATLRVHGRARSRTGGDRNPREFVHRCRRVW